MSLLLGVNIDHIATLRQARYSRNMEAPIVEPSVVKAAFEAKIAGADSLTIHVREDQRHMQEDDALALSLLGDFPLNLEMANTERMTEFAIKTKPDFACIVPESREEVTTEGGLDCVTHQESLHDTVASLQGEGIKVSLFIDPDPDQIETAAALGAEMIELHTGAFAQVTGDKRFLEVARLVSAAKQAHKLGLQVNAGHGIHYDNIRDLFPVPHLAELNIGHAIIARSVFVGLKQAIQEMREAMNEYPEVQTKPSFLKSIESLAVSRSDH